MRCPMLGDEGGFISEALYTQHLKKKKPLQGNIHGPLHSFMLNE